MDDGSSDSSRSILGGAQIDGWDKSVLSQTKRGQSAARNAALRWLMEGHFGSQVRSLS
uniref:glycosyltransferase n=1 Tax=Parolsenella massiliensis TaxID=1871022 RepID=UPI0009F8B78B